MKFYAALKMLLLTSSSLKTMSASTTSSTIEDAVGDGCKNSIYFESKFVTDTSDACNTCHFCSGSKLSDIFDPKKESICVECSSADNKCNSLQLITRFKQPWVMQFVSISSSNMDSKFDPAKIVIQGSADSKSWNKLYDSSEQGGLIFTERNQEKDFLLSNNDKDFNDYMISFKLNDASSKLHLKQYGIVETFTKQCSVQIFNDVSRSNVLPYMTSVPTTAPTDSPTSAAPTSSPLTNDDIYDAVDMWMTDKNKAIDTFGQIRDWNTSEVTKMDNLFSGGRFSIEIKQTVRLFNEDLSNWDVSGVTNMLGMFYGCESFNINLSTWDVSKVGSMRSMFSRCFKLNQSICWDVSKKNTSEMFRDAHKNAKIKCD